MPKYLIAVDGLSKTLEVELEDLSELYPEDHFGVKFVKVNDSWIARDRIIAIAPADAKEGGRRIAFGGSA